MRTITNVVAAVAAMTVATSADAAITININQVGNDVVVTGSGTFDTGGTISRSSLGYASGVSPAFGVVRFGPEAFVTGFSTASVRGPAGFGFDTFRYNFASTTSGDIFGVIGIFDQVMLPLDYVSGSALAGTMTFAGQTFSSLRLLTGQYIYTGTADRVIVNVVPFAAVPEPATWALMIGGLGLVAASMRRRTRVRAIRFA